MSLGLDEVTDSWPILRYVMDISSYEESYQSYVSEFASMHFTEDKMSAIFTKYQSLIGEVASTENTGFNNAVTALSTHVSSRQQAVATYLK